jgi:hypothetical protein
MVDSATAASQNGFCSYKFFLHKKTNIIQNMTKTIHCLLSFIVYPRPVGNLDHFVTLFWCYANSHFKIHRYVAAPSQAIP